MEAKSVIGQDRRAGPLRVFLCHSSGDKPRIRELLVRLRREQWVRPWVDDQDLVPGQDWQLEIQRAIRSAHVVLACLSRESVNKAGYVQRELRQALDVAEEQPEGSIFLIPLLLEPCAVPARLERIQWVNLDQPDGYERLLRALRFRAESLGFEPGIQLPGAADAPSHGLTLVVPSALQWELVNGAQGGYPAVMCGMLGGHANVVETLRFVANAVESLPDEVAVFGHRLPWASGGIDGFYMDPVQLLHAYQEIDDLGLDFVGYFFSRTGSEGRPSRTDIRLATDPSAFYLIVGLQHRANPTLRGWRIWKESPLDNVGEVFEVPVVPRE